MQPLFFTIESDPGLAQNLSQQLGAEIGKLNMRQFPDGESYLRVDTDCRNRSVIIFCNLFQPDEKLLKLIFLASTLRELGAKKIGLITPYLAYMRQDKRFQPGECISSRPFAKLLSEQLDWLVTLDPHLHRYHSLDEIYSLQSRVCHAAPKIAEWIKNTIQKPLLIGPDSESEQWVSHVASLADAPFQVLSKIRRGDYDVEVSLPEVERWQNHTPVLVDDIISSGRTMQETVTHLKSSVPQTAVCIGVHGLFSDEAYSQLSMQAEVITCNSIPHQSNQIDICSTLSDAAREFI